MITYQDLIQVDPSDERRRINMVRSIISEHKGTDAYKMAVTADQYDRKRNTTIVEYEKTLPTLTGQEVPDRWSPNHKTTRNIFNYFVVQENQYL